jgi:hypothetical protein
VVALSLQPQVGFDQLITQARLAGAGKLGELLSCVLQGRT